MQALWWTMLRAMGFAAMGFLVGFSVRHGYDMEQSQNQLHEVLAREQVLAEKFADVQEREADLVDALTQTLEEPELRRVVNQWMLNQVHAGIKEDQP